MTPKNYKDPGQLKNYLEKIYPNLDAYLDKGQDPDLTEGLPQSPSINLESLTKKKSERDLLERAFGKLLENMDLTPPEQEIIEAIVIPNARPVIDIISGDYNAPEGFWGNVGEPSAKERIKRIIPSVGRVEIPGDSNLPFGGTGFVVGRDLIMTNRHVAEIFCSGQGKEGLRFLPGRNAGIDFLEEHGNDASQFLRFQKVVMIHPYWDMALLKVTGLRENQTPLPVSVKHPDDLNGRKIIVIGYPAFDQRNNVKVQNRVFRGIFNVKRLQPGMVSGRQTVPSFGNVVSAMKHDASTLGGNSGSAVIDMETGHIVGLHFGGRYLVANYAVPSYELARDHHVVDAGLNFLGSVESGNNLKWLPLWNQVDPQASEEENDRVMRRQLINVDNSTVNSQVAAPAPTQAKLEDGKLEFTVPIHISISIGDTKTGKAPVVDLKPRQSFTGSGNTEAPGTYPEKNYSNRRGYDPDFLGIEVKLPWLSDEQYQAVAINNEAITNRHVLPYHKFSIVMNRDRKIAFYTAVNIDGSKEVKITRDEFRDEWVLDPRIEEEFQLQNEFYKDSGGKHNPLDRGHLVRRLDPCWGPSREEVIPAHHDTFHWTNSSPQHKRFNRNQTIWAGVENYVLNNANAKDLKVSVFSGPVFKADDPIYFTPTGHQVQLPLAYWKIVCFRKDNGQLSASGYLLEQKGQVDSMLEEFVFASFGNFQTSILQIEEVTGLNFRGLDEADAFVGLTESAADGKAPINSFEDLVL